MIETIYDYYDDLQRYIYYILFKSNKKNKYALIGKRSLATKEKAAKIVKAEIPKIFNKRKKTVTHQLIDLKFKKKKNLKGKGEVFITKETRDIDNRLAYVHASIMFFVRNFMIQEKKTVEFLEKIAALKEKQKIQNLVRYPVDFSKTELGKKAQQEAKKALNIVERTTRTGWVYRSSTSLGEVKKRIKDIFLDLFEDVDFVAVRTKSGKIRKYAVKYYIEMVSRTETAYTSNNASILSCKEWGCDLMIVSEHAGPCSICAPHESEIYSLSGNHPLYPYVDLSWMHPNCAHGIDAYSEVLGVAA